MAETVHFGGAPVKPDVSKLVEKFGDQPKEGTQITHSEITAVIGVFHGSRRYQTVTTAWRDHILKTSSVEIAPLRGVGFEVLDAKNRIASGIKGIHSGARKQSRAVSRVGIVKTEDESLVRRQNAVAIYGMALKAQMAGLMKEIEPPKKRPEDRQPRLIPPASH